MCEVYGGSGGYVKYLRSGSLKVVIKLVHYFSVDLDKTLLSVAKSSAEYKTSHQVVYIPPQINADSYFSSFLEEEILDIQAQTAFCLQACRAA